MMKTIFTLVTLLLTCIATAQTYSFEQKLQSPDPAASERYGSKVAVDGDIMVVTDTRDRQDLIGQTAQYIEGAAYVYRRNANGVWVFEQKLRPVTVDRFSNYGNEIAIKNGIIAVGAPSHARNNNATGAPSITAAGSVFLYTYDSNAMQWIERAQLVAPVREQNALYGASLAFNDSNELFVGEYNRIATNPIVSRSGQVYVYDVNNSGIATLKQIIANPTPNPTDLFGFSIAAHGSAIAIGAIGENLDAQELNDIDDAGAVYIYDKDTTTGIYNISQKIVSGTRVQDAEFGNAVAIQNDVLIAGATNESLPLGNGFSRNGGAAYAFKKMNGTWQQSDRFLPQNIVATGLFGYSVAIHNNIALVGFIQGLTPFNGSTRSTGTVTMYTLDPTSGTSSQNTNIETPLPEFTSFYGGSIAFQGNDVIIGALGDTGDLQGVYDPNKAGAVYTFSLSSTASIHQQAITITKVYPNPATNLLHIDTPTRIIYTISNLQGQVLLKDSYVPAG
ncbi:MAG: FG-GAP repeat protein, partial [Nonlabens sp.]|nr:FG-GAP repeat protein [Nonlabens sp.]